jgi:hypothetical protein
MNKTHYDEIQKGPSSWNAYVREQRGKDEGWVANLMDADLRNANLKFANLMDADLRNANLKFANLEGAYLRGAYLKFANLKFANLKLSNLMDADLRNADLKDADLRNANLMDADLRNANLKLSNLEDADLKGADLRNAALDKAKFSGVPKAPTDLLQQIAVAIRMPDALDMCSYHKCNTCHCLAGWAITLTPGGKKYEAKTSSYLAGALLAPELKHLFFEDNETALGETEKYLPDDYANKEQIE